VAAIVGPVVVDDKVDGDGDGDGARVFGIKEVASRVTYLEKR
jgi:hypothetical protein